MELEDAKGSSQNLYVINSSSPKDLFSLFFMDLVLNRIVRCTNLNVERVQVDLVAARAKKIRFYDSLKQLPQKPVTSSKILIYLRILIYIGIYLKPYINNYQNTSKEDSLIFRSVRKTISIHQQKQMNRYLYIQDLTLDQLFERPNNKVRPYEKVNPFQKLLLLSF